MWRGTGARVLEKRREIMKRRRVTDEYLASWFSYEPVAKPAPKSPCADALHRRGPESCSAVAGEGCHADCPAGHAGHSRALRRLRNVRRRTIPPTRRARGHQVTVYCRQPSREAHLPRRRSSVSAHHPPQVFRHDSPTHFSRRFTCWFIATTWRCTATPPTRSSRGCRG